MLLSCHFLILLFATEIKIIILNFIGLKTTKRLKLKTYFVGTKRLFMHYFFNVIFKVNRQK